MTAMLPLLSLLLSCSGILTTLGATTTEETSITTTTPDNSTATEWTSLVSSVGEDVTTINATSVDVELLEEKENSSSNSLEYLVKRLLNQFSIVKPRPRLLQLLTKINPLSLIARVLQYVLLIASTHRTLVQNRRRVVKNFFVGLVRNSLLARLLNLIRSHILFRIQSGGLLRRLYHWWENRRFAPVRNLLRKLYNRKPRVKLRKFIQGLVDDVKNLFKLYKYLHQHVPPGRFFAGLHALRSLVPIPILFIAMHIALRHVNLATIQVILEQLLDNGLFIIINQIVKGYKIGFTS